MNVHRQRREKWTEEPSKTELGQGTKEEEGQFVGLAYPGVYIGGMINVMNAYCVGRAKRKSEEKEQRERVKSGVKECEKAFGKCMKERRERAKSV